MSRVPLPVLREKPHEGLVSCTECARCCTYVGVGINAPSTPRYATDILWYLYHEKVYVYLDGDREWSVHFEARCRNLADDLLCRVYEDRPHICRGFDNTSCEVNDPGQGSLTFREPGEFLAWLRRQKPRLYGKIESRFIPRALRPPTPSRTPRRRRSAARRTEV